MEGVITWTLSHAQLAGQGTLGLRRQTVVLWSWDERLFDADTNFPSGSSGKAREVYTLPTVQRPSTVDFFETS